MQIKDRHRGISTPQRVYFYRCHPQPQHTEFEAQTPTWRTATSWWMSVAPLQLLSSASICCGMLLVPGGSCTASRPTPFSSTSSHSTLSMGPSPMSVLATGVWYTASATARVMHVRQQGCEQQQGQRLGQEGPQVHASAVHGSADVL